MTPSQKKLVADIIRALEKQGIRQGNSEKLAVIVRCAEVILEKTSVRK